MTPWVLRLIIVNIAVHLLLPMTHGLDRQLEFVGALVLERPWTAITYMFVHQGFAHIFFNMLSLFFFGPRVEAHLGSSKFLGLYFVSGLAGAALSLVFNPFIAIIGASGAVFGVMGAFARYWPREPIYFWGVLPIPARILVIGMAALDLSSGLGFGFGLNQGAIAHFAHVGGFVGGYIFLVIVDRSRQGAQAGWSGPAKRSRPPPRRSVPPPRSSVEKWSRIDPTKLHPVNRGEYDRLMDKIRDEGAQSLTERERAFLDMFADR